MDKYTIYCTPEQTKKALELGAPIPLATYYSSILAKNAINGRNKVEYTLIDNFQQSGDYWCKVITHPTAEQMLGWLEDMGISVKAVCFSWCNENKPTWQVHAYQKSTNFWDEIAFGHSRSYKEATLAAIDAALDYLIDKK